jgi:hypothetical protein
MEGKLDTYHRWSMNGTQDPETGIERKTVPAYSYWQYTPIVFQFTKLIQFALPRQPPEHQAESIVVWLDDARILAHHPQWPPRGEPEAMLLDGSALDDEARLLVSVQAAAERRLGT